MSDGGLWWHEPLEGLQVHPLVFLACNGKEGIDVEMYEALHTSLDLDGLIDVLEMQHVRASWQHAEMFNLEEQREEGRHRGR